MGRLSRLINGLRVDEGFQITQARFGADTGQFYMIKTRDSRFWFYAMSRNKRGTYKGLHVTWYDDKRGPSKAVTKNEMMGSPWRKVDKKDVPPKVMAKFEAKL
jgi:hypothetical protein